MTRIQSAIRFVFPLLLFIMLQAGLPECVEANELEKCIEMYRNKNFEESAECLRALAQQGNPEAQAWLGLYYYEGKGVKQNFEQSVFWFGKAAQKGHINSQISLGNIYRDGKGVKQSFEEAARWYRKASDQGSARAQSELGIFYLLGNGVPQDYDEAAQWFRKSAEQGFAIAQLSLAHCYEFGKGVPLDYEEAVKWLNRAAAQGSKDAKDRLARLDESSKNSPSAPRLSDSEYLDIARMAAEKYKDCDDALNASLEVSEQGRKDPEWSLQTAKLFECVKNFNEAYYYYRKYDSLKPGQPTIADKITALQSLLIRNQQGGAKIQKADQATASDKAARSGSCVSECSQASISCGAAEKCRKAYSACLDACQDRAMWKNVSAASAVSVSDIRFWSYPDYTRVFITLLDKADFTKLRMSNPDRLVFDIKNCKIKKEQQRTIVVENDMLKSVRSNQFNETTARIVLDLMKDIDFKVITEDEPVGINIYLFRKNRIPPFL